jgi:hypothetical protein
MAKPIKPGDVEAAQASTFPGEVFDAFNELIAENYSGGRAAFKQKDAVARIKQKLLLVEEGEIFRRGWLNVEPAYRNEGWDVEYDAPGYCESYAATYTFKKR